ncbi:MAG: hypothetical protein ACP5PT_01005 [Brevinematia bacterium]
MIDNIIFAKAMPQRSDIDEDFVVYTVADLYRNIDGYDFSNRLDSRHKEEIILKITDFVRILPDSSQIYDISFIADRDIEILGLIDREFIESDILRFLGNDLGVSIYCESNLKYFIYTNVFNHFSLRSVVLGNGIEKVFDVIESVSILFDDYFVPTFSRSYGYITNDLATVGHGVKIRFLLNIWGLRGSSVFESVLGTLASNGIFYHHNPLYDKTSFMEFFYVFNPDKSMIANKILLSNLLSKVKEVELAERKKSKGKKFNLYSEYQDFKNTIKMANFIHYKAFLGLMSKLSMLVFFGNEFGEKINLNEMINFFTILLRDTSIMLYSGITVSNDSIIGKERASILKKFFKL